MTEERSGTVDPTVAGESLDDVPVLERDETDTRGIVTMRTSDVTAWCPYEGTADYYDVEITYLPDSYVVELMSFRDYFQSYREEVIGHEVFAQRVFCHLTTLLAPEWLHLVVDAPPRYGIETTIVHDTRDDGDSTGTGVSTPSGDDAGSEAPSEEGEVPPEEG